MYRKWLNVVSFVILVITLCLITGCDKAAIGGNLIGGTQINPIKDYGNGVYYIGSREEVFGSQLSIFKKDIEAKKQHIVCIAPNDTGGYGVTLGYFVIVEKNKEKQETQED
jgi:hypothetical protein